jgi:hypothetical protein
LGITINALVMPDGDRELESYYQFLVIGGEDAFEPPPVCRRAFVSNVRLLFHVQSRFHRTSPLLRAA